jgi:predicted CXXCH cytochrome family protein
MGHPRRRAACARRARQIRHCPQRVQSRGAISSKQLRHKTCVVGAAATVSIQWAHSRGASMSHFRRNGLLKLQAFLRPWMLLAAILLPGLPSAWLGVRLAAAALPEPSASAALPQPPAGAVAGVNSHMTSAQCLECHRTESVLSHPNQVVPTMSVPADFPLDEGQVNCITCHRDTFAEHAGVTAGHALLRGELTGQAFCAACHAQEGLSRQGQHATALTKAHLVWPGRPRVDSVNPFPSAHDDSKACLSCHDGTIAADSFGGARSSGIAADALTGHPIAVAYPAGGAAQAGLFKPLAGLDIRVRLCGGEVTCNTCHSLYSKEPGQLVLRNDASALCTACHVQ